MPTTNSETEILNEADESLYEYEEAQVASGTTIYPGMVLEKNGSTGDYEPKPTVQPVQTADEVGRNFIVALAPSAPPRGSDSDIPREHEYDAGENIEIAVCQPGCEVQNALLCAATNNSSTGDSKVDSYDDPLTTNDDGGLAQHSKAGAIMARAREASVDNSGNAGTEGGIQGLRINVEVV